MDIKTTSMMLPPGIYQVTVSANGSMVWQPNKIIHPNQDEPEPEKTLEAIWSKECRLTFEAFRAELSRQNLIDGNKLKLTGGQVKGCYYFLRNVDALPDMPLTEVFHLFSGSFELKFNSERSLQTWDYDVEFFKNLFSFFRFSKNEI